MIKMHNRFPLFLFLLTLSFHSSSSCFGATWLPYDRCGRADGFSVSLEIAPETLWRGGDDKPPPFQLCHRSLASSLGLSIDLAFFSDPSSAFSLSVCHEESIQFLPDDEGPSEGYCAYPRSRPHRILPQLVFPFSHHSPFELTVVDLFSTQDTFDEQRYLSDVVPDHHSLTQGSQAYYRINNSDPDFEARVSLRELSSANSSFQQSSNFLPLNNLSPQQILQEAAELCFRRNGTIFLARLLSDAAESRHHFEPDKQSYGRYWAWLRELVFLSTQERIPFPMCTFNDYSPFFDAIDLITLYYGPHDPSHARFSRSHLLPSSWHRDHSGPGVSIPRITWALAREHLLNDSRTWLLLTAQIGLLVLALSSTQNWIRGKPTWVRWHLKATQVVLRVLTAHVAFRFGSFLLEVINQSIAIQILLGN